MSSIKGCFPSKVVLHPRLSHIKGHLVLKVIFNQSSSSIKVRIAPKFVFHQSLSSIKFHLPSKFFFHQRSFSIKAGRIQWSEFSEMVRIFGNGPNSDCMPKCGQKKVRIWLKSQNYWTFGRRDVTKIKEITFGWGYFQACCWRAIS